MNQIVDGFRRIKTYAKSPTQFQLITIDLLASQQQRIQEFMTLPYVSQENTQKCSLLNQRYDQIKNILIKYRTSQKPKNFTNQAKNEILQILQSLNIMKNNKEDIGWGDKEQYEQLSYQDNWQNNQTKFNPIKPYKFEDFFKRKEEQLKNNIGFKDIKFNAKQAERTVSRIVSHGKISNKKKKEMEIVLEEYQKKLKKLKQEQQQYQELNDFEKKLLKEEKQMYAAKTQELHQELEALYRENLKMKELSNDKNDNTMRFPEERNFFDSPYIMKTRSNDLQKLTKKENSAPKDQHDWLGNQLDLAISQYEKKSASIPSHRNSPLVGNEDSPISDQVKHPFSPPPAEIASGFRKTKMVTEDSRPMANEKIHKQLQNQRNQSIYTELSNYSRLRQPSRYDSFSMTNYNSIALNESQMSINRRNKKITGVSSTRNKVAFFKNAMVMIKEETFELAFKRSQLSSSMRHQRIILYLHNKLDYPQQVKVTYDFEPGYYHLEVNEKMNRVEPQSQQREVVNLKLINKYDINSVPNAKLYFGDQVYDFWFPVKFIEYASQMPRPMDDDNQLMEILPDRQFSNSRRMGVVAPLLGGGINGGLQWAYLWVRTPFGESGVKIMWSGNSTSIEAKSSLIYYLGFILHFYK